MESVGVVIGIYTAPNDRQAWKYWSRLSLRALDSVVNQTHADVRSTCVNAPTLSEARNSGAWYLDTDWLIFLDADDELDTQYVEHMLAAEGDIRWPSTLGVYDDGSTDDHPVLLQPKPNLLQGNHMVIGSMIKRDLFYDVGGFRELPILEDWDLWIRCWLAGAKTAPCPEAIYKVHVSRNGRNTNPAHNQIYNEIQQRYTALAIERGLL